MTQGKLTVSDNEIVEKMNEKEDPAFTTGELADLFDMTTEGIRGRLEELHEEGGVHKKKPSTRTVLWWTEQDQREPALST